MDLDLLFHRESLDGLPVSLLVRPGRLPVANWNAVVDRAMELLKDRPQADEVVLLLPRNCREAKELPARKIGKRIRPITCDEVDSGAALANGIAECRYPAIVLVDENFELGRDEFAKFLGALNQADLVVGKRPGRWIGRPLDWLARWIFSVPVADPLCPVRAIRKSGADGIALQTNGEMVPFELIAKMTFRTSLMDELPLANGSSQTSVVTALLSNRAAGVRTMMFPDFGSASKTVPAPDASKLPPRPIPGSFGNWRFSGSSPSHLTGFAQSRTSRCELYWSHNGEFRKPWRCRRSRS